MGLGPGVVPDGPEAPWGGSKPWDMKDGPPIEAWAWSARDLWIWRCCAATASVGAQTEQKRGPVVDGKSPELLQVPLVVQAHLSMVLATLEVRARS